MEFYCSTDASPSVERLFMYATDGVSMTLSASLTSTEIITIRRNAIATTSSDGLVVENTTAATSIIPVQMSTRARFGARVWNTTGAGSPETSNWIIENLPTSGTTPSSLLKFGYSRNGGTYSYPMTLSNAGELTVVSLRTNGGNMVVGNDTSISTSTSTRFSLSIGSSTVSPTIARNINDAATTFTFNNAHASSTGKILSFQAVSVEKSYIHRDGVYAGAGIELPNIIKKVASANIRNSHNAEATSTSATYVKVKTITLTHGLLGQQRFIFEIKTSDSVTPETAYGKIYRNGVALGTEQSDLTGSYVSKSEDITQT